MSVTNKTKKDLLKEIDQLRKQVHELMSMQNHSAIEEEHEIPNLPLKMILEKAQEAIVVIQDGRHKYANKKASEINGYSIKEMYDKHFKDTVHPDDHIQVLKANILRLHGNTIKYRYRIIDNKGQIKNLESFGIGIEWERKPATLCFVTDITTQINAENALKEKKIALEQTNTALNILLKHREKDLTEVEEKVVNNMKELILPYIAKLKTLRLSSDIASYIDILEKHANEITSPFMQKISHKYSNLTPREIQIAILIKDGKTTKEICEILNLADNTVNNHKKNIRKKLGLKSREDNLRSYLLSFT